MSNLENFEELKSEIVKPAGIAFNFYEHKVESFAVCRISGSIPDGSEGKDIGLYLYQQLTLAIITEEPNAVLVDLRDFTYKYGTAIVKLLDVFSIIKIFGDDEVLAAFIVSEKNKFGIASLCNFDPENPRIPFFTDFEKGYNYLFDLYEKI